MLKMTDEYYTNLYDKKNTTNCQSVTSDVPDKIMFALQNVKCIKISC